MTETLELTLLGNPEVRLAGQPLGRFRSAKVYALLYYLAVTRRPQPRTVLAGLFWGDVDEYYARRNFSRTLSDLTQFVGDHLVIERQSVAFAHEQPHWLDVAILESAATTTPTAHNVAALAAAANLYRGDFLDGFYVQDAPAFEQWVLTERTRLHAAVLQLLHTLADYEAGQGKLTHAMTYARRLLQLEPWHEEAHRQLMLLLAQSGQRSAALAQFELCRQALHSELNVDPDAATLDLVEHIRAGKIDRVTGDKVTGDKVTSDKVTSTSSVTRSPPHPVTPSPWHNLPSPLTTFVGRRSEIDTVKQLLKQHRLLTLTGPGGIGKTRLALQAAAEMVGFFPDGICFVELASINQAALVINTLAHLLGVKEALDTPLASLIQAALRDRAMLLVLDNFEHLLDAAALIADLLAAAPALTVLTTSREVLALYGEQEYAVPPLQLPNVERFAVTHHDPSSLLNNESLQLFERSAQSVAPDFRLTAENAAAVATLCLRLDGLPLAIELAAARVKVMSVEAIAQHLNSMVGARFHLLTRTGRALSPRQQTLHAAIAWSYDLLDEEEARLFRQAAIFPDSFTYEALQEIAELGNQNLLNLLQQLIDKSLIVSKPARSQQRYRMLESIREFALGCFTAEGELGRMQRRHATYFLGLAEQARPHLRRDEQVQWLARLSAEHDNLRAALRWALDNGEAEIAARICWSLSTFWWLRNYLSEGRRWVEQLLVHKAQLPLPLRIRALAAMLSIAYGQGNLVSPEPYALELLELSQQAGRDALAEAFAQTCFGQAAALRDDTSKALYHLALAIPLFQEAGEEGLASQLTAFIGAYHLRRDDYEQALPYLETGLTQAQRVGDRHGMTLALFNLGQVALVRKELAVAKQRFAEGLPYLQALADRAHIANFLEGLAAVAGTEGNHTHAATLFGAAQGLFERAGMRGHTYYQPYHARYAAIRTEVEQALGSVSYTALWHTGWAMSLEQATDFALA